MLHIVILVFFPVLMVFAALSDLFTMTISNRISIALIALFVPLAFWAGMPTSEILVHMACGAGVLLLTFALFSFGWIGGGDAKLAAATAVWMGLAHLADYGVVSALMGGALTLAILGMRYVPLPGFALRLQWLVHLHDRKTGIPYGIALAAAGLFLYPQTGIWQAASLA